MPRPPRPPKDPGEPKARAVKLLARREHSARELKRKLEQRGFSGDDAERVIGELGREGWQSDTRYAELLVRSRISGGYGPVRIEAELRQAGVSSADTRTALEAPGVDWLDLCRQVHARRFRDLPDSAAGRARHYRFLQGRGFDASQIGSVLRGGDDD